MLEKTKYPRTYHLLLDPLIQSIGSDDKVLKDFSNFQNKEIVILEKMDGENTTLSNQFYHARSLDTSPHPSRDWVKGLWGNCAYQIPPLFKICGENLWAVHSIHYTDLDSYFQVFNIWEKDRCLSYDDTLEWCELLNLTHVKVLWKGIWDLDKIKEIYLSLDKSCHEGIVIRLAESFSLTEFKTSVCKMVRKEHVNSDEHWLNKPIIKNNLKN
jgi:hypothetical protein